MSHDLRSAKLVCPAGWDTLPAVPDRTHLLSGRIRRPHRHEWLWEPLATEPTFVLRSMFGAKAVYLHGRLMLCFCDGEEPWRGVLVCTSREHQTALIAEFPELRPHPILPKWLYLAERLERFEAAAARLVALARRRDQRIGVLPKSRKRESRPSRK